MMMNMAGWIMKDNYFNHVCYWIDTHLEWLIELELEAKTEIKDLLFTAFQQNRPLKPKTLHV